MTPQTAQTVNAGDTPLSPEDAWKLWHQLNLLAQSLWEAYEQHFLQFCIQEAADQGHNPPPPFD